MVLLQALLGYVQRFLGRIVQSIFGWAVLALFGEVEEGEKTLLSAVVGGAAVWPLLLAGVAFPRVAALILTLAPIPKWFPAGWLRLVWISLTALVPIVVGIALAKRGRRRSARAPFWKTVWRGFPITFGVAGAFLIAFFASPIRKILALFHEEKEDHVALIVPRESYEEVAAELADTLAEAGLPLQQERPPWTTRAISGTLRVLGGPELRSQIPERLAYLRCPELEFVLYPNGVTLLGAEAVTMRAHALIAERASRTAAFQTTDAAAQKVERRIKAVWRAWESAGGSGNHRKSLAEVLAAVADLQVGFAQWQIVYREALQLAVVVHGGGEVLRRALESEHAALRPRLRGMTHRPRRFARRAKGAAQQKALTGAANTVITVAQKLADRAVAAFRLR